MDYFFTCLTQSHKARRISIARTHCPRLDLKLFPYPLWSSEIYLWIIFLNYWMLPITSFFEENISWLTALSVPITPGSCIWLILGSNWHLKASVDWNISYHIIFTYTMGYNSDFLPPFMPLAGLGWHFTWVSPVSKFFPLLLGSSN